MKTNAIFFFFYLAVPGLVLASSASPEVAKNGDMKHLTYAIESQGKRLSESIDTLADSLECKGRSPAAPSSRGEPGGLVRELRDALALEDEVATLKAEVARLKEKSGRSRGTAVHFNAFSSKRLECFDCVVAYENVNVDTHGALDASTGKFVCPVSGNYFFQFHALADHGREAKIHLVTIQCTVITVVPMSMISP